MGKRVRTSRLICNSTRGSESFTLIEMLVVIAVAAILAVLALPALTGLQTAGGFNQSVYAIADLLNLARSYALANNTYVYVGLTEVDRTVSTTTVPQTSITAATAATTGGRVALAIVASEDGTNNYNTTTGTLTPSNLIQVRPIQVFDFLHIYTGAGATGVWASTGSMTRTTGATVTYTGSVSSTTVPVPTFFMPLNGTAKYNFTAAYSSVIMINPQGGLLLNGSQKQRLEIDFQPFVGTVATTATQLNVAAVVLDGISGAAIVYRP